MKSPIISIIIPTKNGEKTIDKCLNAIKNQTLFEQTEVIVIDSGSTDRTLELINNYKFVKLYKIEPSAFNHGATRNYGVSLACGDFVVMTVQDAWASDNQWLEKMYEHFADNKVAAVVGQQVVPHDNDKNPHQWWRPVSKPRIVETFYENPTYFLNLSGKQQDEECFYDNVNSMYRKSVLFQIPFDNLEYGEDMMIIKKIIAAGFKVIYDANCSVWHYHYQSKEYVYKSTVTELYFKNLIFNYVPKYSLSLKELLLIVYRNFRYKASIKWIFHNWNIKLYRYKAYKKIVKNLKKGNEHLLAFYKKINPTIVQGKS